MIDVQQVRELIELMVENGLSEIRINEGETKIQLRKGPEFVQGQWPTMQMPVAGQFPQAAAPVPQMEASGQSPDVVDEGLVAIPSPMVGTFYSASDPDSTPFVSEGTEVDASSTVCVIEAMKVFNEIKADVAGTIERILVHNGQAVEYGEPLMLVRLRS